MKASLLCAALAGSMFLTGCDRSEPMTPASGVSSEQRIIDRSAAAFSTMHSDPDFRALDDYLPRARGVLIFPRVIKAAFGFGGEGGNGVLVARTPDGGWSAPAFYSIGAGGVGLQLGYQETTLVLLLMRDSALFSVIDGGITLGADATVAAGTVGDTGESRRANTSADVIQFANAGGVFAGVSLDGAVIKERESFNRRYYGSDAGAYGILVERKFSSPGVDVLHRALQTP
jgi:lipid-binding SYLF domain-containing protein